MKKYIGLLIIAFIVTISCNKDEKSTALCDIYYFSTADGETVKYGLSIHATTLTQTMSSVTVTSLSEPDQIYQLKTFTGAETMFYFDTPENQLSEEKPAAGDYRFNVKFANADTYETDDELQNIVLQPPVIVKCEYDATESKAIIEWEQAENADEYNIQIYDGSTLVFQGGSIHPSYDGVKISSDFDGWGDYMPETGKTYKLRLIAVKYETAELNGFEIQAVTRTEHDLTWGE